MQNAPTHVVVPGQFLLHLSAHEAAGAATFHEGGRRGESAHVDGAAEVDKLKVDGLLDLRTPGEREKISRVVNKKWWVKERAGREIRCFFILS